MKDPNHEELKNLWVCDCFMAKLHEIQNFTKTIISKWWRYKHFNLNMGWASESVSGLFTFLSHKEFNHFANSFQ